MNRGLLFILVLVWSTLYCYNIWRIFPRFPFSVEGPGDDDEELLRVKHFTKLDLKDPENYKKAEPLDNYTLSENNLSYCDWQLVDFMDTVVRLDGGELPTKSDCIAGFPLTKNAQGMITNIPKLISKDNFRHVSCKERKAYLSPLTITPKALTSFPGSGNTWVRHLLEQLTGQLTGSVYCGVVRGTFRGECLTDTTHLLTIKTHRPSTSPAVYPYSRAVLLIRNPFDAFVAEFNRIYSGKIHHVRLRSFRTSTWKKFVDVHLKIWTKHALSWLVHFQHPVYVLFYERLKTHLVEELIRLTDFLYLKPTYSDIWCTNELREGRYHRQRAPWNNTMLLYSKRQRMHIFRSIKYVNTLLRKFHNVTFPFLHDSQLGPSM